MSYIRCLSNPESLYIWEDGTHANISHGVPGPLSSSKERDGDPALFLIPTDVWREGLKLWHDKYGEPIDHEGMAVREEHIHLDTAELVPEQTILEMLDDRREAGYRIRLEYKGEYVYLWRVTWEYVVGNRKT
jgi:hypothetical protein